MPVGQASYQQNPVDLGQLGSENTLPFSTVRLVASRLPGSLRKTVLISVHVEAEPNSSQ